MPKAKPSKPSTTEAALAQIHAVRQGFADGDPTVDLKRDLTPFLSHKSNHVIAAAAATVKRFEFDPLGEELNRAFLAIFPDAAKRDPGCKALIAIAEALVTLGEIAPETYRKGVHHVQMEGSFGPPVDVASPLRGLCARGLARTRDPEAMETAIDLLLDREPPARIGAVEALADAGTREAELLLRLKARTGDREDEVTGACLSALLAIAPRRSLPFVAAFLDSNVPDAAALALGESKMPEALPYLIQAWQNHRGEGVRRVILLSIGMLRDPAAIEYLITRLQQDSPVAAAASVEALALYRSDEQVWQRVEEIAHRRGLRV